MRLGLILLGFFFFTAFTGYSQDTDDLVGRWKWVKSNLSGRGGHQVNKSVNEIVILEVSNKLDLKEYINGGTSSRSIYPDDIYIKNDTLVTYKYLGCPSIRAYYVRLEK